MLTAETQRTRRRHVGFELADIVTAEDILGCPIAKGEAIISRAAIVPRVRRDLKMARAFRRCYNLWVTPHSWSARRACYGAHGHQVRTVRAANHVTSG